MNTSTFKTSKMKRGMTHKIVLWDFGTLKSVLLCHGNQVFKNWIIQLSTLSSDEVNQGKFLYFSQTPNVYVVLPHYLSRCHIYFHSEETISWNCFWSTTFQSWSYIYLEFCHSIRWQYVAVLFSLIILYLRHGQVFYSFFEPFSQHFHYISEQRTIWWDWSNMLSLQKNCYSHKLLPLFTSSCLSIS